MTVTTAPGPTPVTARALGPDLARGFMLLFIALANSHYFLTGPSVLGGFPQDGSGLDRVLTWVLATFVDGRSYPMFGLLFGYGVARIVARNEALGPKAVRHLLWRRSLFLIVVGFVHCVLLFAGDILAAYGVLLLVGAWVVRWRDRWLLVTAALFLVLLSLPSPGSLSTSAALPDASMLPPDVWAMFTQRPPVSLYVATLGPVGFVPSFTIGLWAGRRRILERPQEHRRLLGLTAGMGLTAAVLGAQPVALVLSGAVDVPSPDTLNVIGPLHDSLGVLGGIGYAALIALIAGRLEKRPPTRMVDAIAAVGQRSMTCYLCQSVVWAVVFTPFLLGLADDLTVASTAVLAAGTWLATVVLADRLRRAGRRGPFEILVRRATYGRPVTAPSGAGPAAP